MPSLESSAPESSRFRLGATFARKFHLVRPAIAQVLAVAAKRAGSTEESRPTLDNMLQDATSLGTVYIQSMPRYACGTGLLDPRTYLPTAFGWRVHAVDPALEHLNTLWLMHYFLASPAGMGPESWEFLFRKTSTELRQSRTEIEASVRAFLGETKGKHLSPASIKSNVASTFKNTYTSPDSFGKLGVLQSAGDWLVPGAPPAPGGGVIGYALAHFWDVMWPDAGVVPLRDVSSVAGLAGLFLLSPFELNAALRDLQTAGVLELWQVAPPHQVRRRFVSADSLIPSIYA